MVMPAKSQPIWGFIHITNSTGDERSLVCFEFRIVEYTCIFNTMEILTKIIELYRIYTFGLITAINWNIEYKHKCIMTKIVK